MICSSECKHGKVDISWSLHKFKWKWLQTIYWLNNILIYKSNQFMLKIQPQKSLHILADNASRCASDHIEQVIVKKMFKLWLNSI